MLGNIAKVVLKTFIPSISVVYQIYQFKPGFKFADIAISINVQIDINKKKSIQEEIKDKPIKKDS